MIAISIKITIKIIVRRLSEHVKYDIQGVSDFRELLSSHFLMCLYVNIFSFIHTKKMRQTSLKI